MAMPKAYDPPSEAYYNGAIIALYEEATRKNPRH